MALSFKGAHLPQAIILTGVRWHVAHPLSDRQVEELMEERGVSVDHTTIHRWVLKYTLRLGGAFHRRKRPVGRSWRMDETDSKVKGEWRCLSRLWPIKLRAQGPESRDRAPREARACPLLLEASAPNTAHTGAVGVPAPRQSGQGGAAV